MKIMHLAAASAAMLLAAGAVSAQEAGPSAEPVPAPEAATPPIDSGGVSGGGTAAGSASSSVTDPPPPAMEPSAVAPSAQGQGTDVASTAPMMSPTVLTNGPVPDTKENRDRFGQPNSNAGKRSAAKGN
jgi:hypothetical protein